MAAEFPDAHQELDGRQNRLDGSPRRRVASPALVGGVEGPLALHQHSWARARPNDRGERTREGRWAGYGWSVQPSSRVDVKIS